MQTRILASDGSGSAKPCTELVRATSEGWVWLDARIDDEVDLEEMIDLIAHLEFDQLAVRDAFVDDDLPKIDDFGHHLLVILHGLRDDRVATYEIDCFVTANVLVTVHRQQSPSIDALWESLQVRSELAAGGVDELLARLADVVARRLLAVIDAFDSRTEDLIGSALSADAKLLSELTAVRADLAAVRRVAQPQRELLDLLRRTSSTLVSDTGRRRFSDVFDVASRTTQGLDAARGALAEILDAYRGAEARQATDVAKILTIYAAMMLPLSLVAGFFGMNFSNLPLTDRSWGWIAVTVAMVVVATASLGVFVAVGWIGRPSGRAAGATLGRGLIEAARAPSQVAGALYEISTMPMRTVRRSKPAGPERAR